VIFSEIFPKYKKGNHYKVTVTNALILLTTMYSFLVYMLLVLFTYFPVFLLF
jgi:hypothetical protein